MKYKLLIIALALNTNIYANDTLWVAPSKDSCKSKSGQVISKGVCNAKWEDAKSICASNVGRLPTIDELEQEVQKCKNISKGDKNKYNACYINNGFVGTSSYWSSTTHEKFSTSAWGMNFYSGVKANGSKENHVDVRCVKLK